MADESGATAADTAPNGTDGGDIEFVAWSYRLLMLERIQSDEVDDLEDIFAAKFHVDGPDANAEVEIIVSDFEDEADVLGIALDTLHRAMKAWGRITENRRIEARDVDELKGD